MRGLFAIAVAAANLLVGGCSHEPVTRVEWTVMGTVAAVQCRGDSVPAELRESVRKSFADVERLLNAHDPQSEIRKLSAKADEEILALCDPLVRPCYAAAFRLRDLTGGVFNPRWKGKGTFDLGAIAKGFAVDLAADSSSVSKPFLVDLGGNLKTSGDSWKVGVQIPSGDAGTTSEFTLAKGSACATSGEYYRGKHIKDGRNGRDFESGVRSVTVIHPNSAMLADGLSTILFILGREKGESFLREHFPEARAVWIE